ncbi:MAG: hypothetical protein ACREMO_06610, partial [Gemmatimonadales bacterium]
FQPRVGVVYLPGELGSQRLFGSWGRFYEQLPLVLATVYYGEGSQILITYPQNPLLDPTGADTLAIPIGGAPRVDGLRGEYFDEITIGYERRVGRQFKAGVRAIQRSLRWAIEDGYNQAQDRFVVGNPGRGALVQFPRARREYSALEFTFGRLSSAKVTFLISYVLSRTWGNFSGLFTSDVGGVGGAPNVSPQFDFAEQTPLGTGLLPNDRTHVFKSFGAYRFNFGLTAGASLFWESGTPRNEYGAIFAGPPYWSFLRRRGTAGRTPAIWDLNLRYTYLLPVGPRSELRPQVVLDLFHVGSPRKPVDFDQVHYTAVDATGNQTGANPAYGAVARYQPPMSARLGLVVEF